jgi:hypothetical protein
MPKLESNEIIPGKGIGQIKLGMEKETVKDLLGEPEETEEHIYPEGDKSVTFSYAEEGFDLTFESANDNRLSYLSFFTENFHILDAIRIGQKKEEVLKTLKEMNFSKPQIEDYEDDFPGNELVFLKSENLNLWFSRDVLDEIQVGPLWKDDETPIWP